jgi:hypothetical protein
MSNYYAASSATMAADLSGASSSGSSSGSSNGRESGRTASGAGTGCSGREEAEGVYPRSTAATGSASTAGHAQLLTAKQLQAFCPETVMVGLYECVLLSCLF